MTVDAKKLNIINWDVLLGENNSMCIFKVFKNISFLTIYYNVPIFFIYLSNKSPLTVIHSFNGFSLSSYHTLMCFRETPAGYADNLSIVWR